VLDDLPSMIRHADYPRDASAPRHEPTLTVAPAGGNDQVGFFIGKMQRGSLENLEHRLTRTRPSP